MTSEKQRVALAEFAGWRFGPEMKDAQTVLEPGYQARKEGALLCWVKPGNEWFRQERIPDYLHDLNAIHEVEKLLSKDQQIQFLMRLSQPVLTAMPLDPSYAEEQWCLVTMTAKSRCEAILRAIGKWEESE